MSLQKVIGSDALSALATDIKAAIALKADSASVYNKTETYNKDEVNELIDEAVPTRTATGNPCSFETDAALPLASLKASILATGGGGTPSTPIPIVGHSELNLVRTSENLFTSMSTATNDGITTSYDSSTGDISITNDSRTTNYGSGSMRSNVATGLNSAHTYRYLVTPNVNGVVLCDENSTVLNNEFTGITTAKLKITNLYDFVNDHPIGDTTRVKLLIVDITEGSYTPYLVQFGQTVYGGVYDANAGKVRITHKVTSLTDMEQATIGSANVFVKILSDAKTPASNSEIANIDKAPYTPIRYFGVTSNVDTIALSVSGVLAINTGSLTPPVGEVRYELATPIEIDVSELSVDAIVGVNNIVSDCGGDVTVGYNDAIDKLVKLDDVNISNPVNGQFLKYDSASEKWVNATGGGATPWTDITGTLTAGQTSLTLSDAAITTSSTVDVYTDTYGVNPTAISVANGSVTLTFDEQAADLGVKVRVS